uniref:Family with sequence similarity 83 member G n=1 Tax=Zonotrichia albicollis TaxID=44394 RepID=A0A8D2MD92_ZONAL
MHLLHSTNLRVRSTGGTEFFTRSATKFKGALAQKFMFVDGDRAMCGSYSFTWSAARTDRNVITVLSGQVVEAFDKQFQELYLMSKGVSLKSISMGEEPEPEPVTLPSVVPVTPANAVVKKLINPKYALVKAKSADQISKTSSENQDKNQKSDNNKGKATPEGQAGERHGDVAELAPLIHPGLLNLEKANMFDYLPTWVEPDPEPGSEVLGYINIIDPKVKNVKLSQMNRIKVCDVSQASAQHRQIQIAQPPMEAPAAPTTTPIEGALEDVKPPVPKPRTVPVGVIMTRVPTGCDSSSALQGDTQPALAEHTAVKQEREDKPSRAARESGRAQPERPAAAPQEGKGPPCAHNGLGEEEEEEEEEFITLSDQESYSSSSADHSYRRSNASSISDEYFEVRDRYGPLRRTNSDVTHNGDILPMQRKLSDPHISRGTFISPLGSLPSLKHLDMTKRRTQSFNRRTSNTPEPCRARTGRELGKELSCSPTTQEKPLRASKHAGEGAEPKKTIAGSQPYWQSKALSPSKATAATGRAQRLSSLPQESPRAPEEMRTPLGIPLSKLSQSKHLKNRVAGAQGACVDSKKAPPEPTGQKEQ